MVNFLGIGTVIFDGNSHTNEGQYANTSSMHKQMQTVRNKRLGGKNVQYTQAKHAAQYHFLAPGHLKSP